MRLAIDKCLNFGNHEVKAHASTSAFDSFTLSIVFPFDVDDRVQPVALYAGADGTGRRL
eukprot:m.155363 g.155363  ORF g.155363 m.155363 type:complete len:59 (+) comp16276_c2_seq1:2366-2542(+)